MQSQPLWKTVKKEGEKKGKRGEKEEWKEKGRKKKEEMNSFIYLKHRLDPRPCPFRSLHTPFF